MNGYCIVDGSSSELLPEKRGLHRVPPIENVQEPLLSVPFLSRARMCWHEFMLLDVAHRDVYQPACARV